MMQRRHIVTKYLCGALFAVLLAGCEPISEPWVSGQWGKQLENERTRTPEQKRELGRRLQMYGGAYQ